MTTKTSILGLLLIAAALIFSGCASAEATKTTIHIGADGKPVVVTDTVKVKSLLNSIKNGKYSSTNSDGTGQTLSTDESTPDQQSIAVLSGGVVELGKAALLLASKPNTNAPPAPSTTTTNAP